MAALVERGAVVGLIAAATIAASSASAGTPTVEARASAICARIQKQIVQLPSSVTRLEKVTSANGDRWLASLVAGFRATQVQLAALRPPAGQGVKWRQMTSEFGAASKGFAAAKRLLDRGDHDGFERAGRAAAEHAGHAAGIAEKLDLGECGP